MNDRFSEVLSVGLDASKNPSMFPFTSLGKNVSLIYELGKPKSLSMCRVHE